MSDPDELPEPLTPKSCDLRDFPYMPVDVVQWRDSEMAVVLSPEEHLAAWFLHLASWHQVPAASLPTDDRVLANLAGFGRDVAGWQMVKSGALHGFVLCKDGRLYHPWSAKKALEAWDKKWNRPDRVSERSEHAQKAARARWSNARALPEHVNEQSLEHCSSDALKGTEEKGGEKNGEGLIQKHESTQVPEGIDLALGSRSSEPNKLKHLVVKTIAPALFEQFWRSYPERAGANPKEPARQRFLDALKQGVDADMMVASAKAYAAEIQRSGQTNTAYVAQVVTWLSQARWKDYAPTADDKAKHAQTDEWMLSRGYVWSGGKWVNQGDAAA